jgi:integrase
VRSAMAEKRTRNRLTELFVKKKVIAPARYADGGGLYLSVRKGDSRQWVYLYRWQGKLKEMGLGGVRDFPLKAAREKAEAARTLTKNGIDPLAAKRETAAKEAAAKSFGVFALEYLDSIESGFRNEKHRWQWRQTLTAHCKPVWDLPLDRVDVDGVLECVQPLWETKQETASRLRGRIERVLDAAKARRLRSGENPAAWRGNLKLLLPKRAKLSRGHHPALPYIELPTFIADLRKRDAMAALALEFTILTAARTGEVLGARWGEIDFDTSLWTVPAARMKAGREHRVPLNKRAVEVLEKVSQIRTCELVFPGPRAGKALSNMSMIMLLRRMNGGELTVHGFRSAFSDWASEVSPFSAETRETALAHQIANKVEASYRRGDALEKRRAMMESWGAFCEPREARNVVEFRRGA